MSSTPYVSPVAQARELLASLRSEHPPAVSRRVVATARRIARLEPVVAGDLERAEAPYKVMRWVAWADRMTTRRQRADLVLHLRHTIQTSRGGWLREPQLRAALDAWQRAVDEARRRGLVQPRPEELPVEAYTTAIAAVTRSTRRPPRETSEDPARATPILLSAEERAALAALPVLEGLLKRVG